MTECLEVGLLWHSDNSGNLGVGALTVANMALAQKAAGEAGVSLRFHLFKSGDSGSSYIRDGLAARHTMTGRYTFNPKGFWHDLKALDIVLDIAAGDSFADIYPNKRFLYQAATKCMVLRAGIPLVLSPQTIGPFSRQPHSLVAARILKRARAVFARDPISLAATRRLAPAANAHETIDVAFALPFTPQPRSAAGEKRRFGIGISGLLYGGGYTGKNEFSLDIDYRAFTHALIEALLARGDTDIILVKHVQAPHLPVDDDATAARQLKARYPALVDGPGFASPGDAKSFISGLDFLVAGRMHASIAAFSAGTPVVPFSYSRKFEGLYGALRYRWLIPQHGMTQTEALELTLNAFEHRSEIKENIVAGNKIAADLQNAYCQPLAAIFRDIANQKKGA